MLVWGRNPDHAAACATDLTASLGIPAEVALDPRAMVQACQLVVTTTPTRRPILMADWLHPGLHITAMGADQTGKGELDPKALVEADLYVCDRVSQCETSGELESALAAGLWTKGTPVELGQIISGSATGRSSESDITICDLTGTGAQDTAIASHVHSVLGNAGAIIDN